MQLSSKDLHAIHPYPCKFPANVAARFVPKGGVLLDPFCGSGTTLLEGALAGCAVYGFDCNPIAQLISKCKLVELSDAEKDTLLKTSSLLQSGSANNRNDTFALHDFPGKDHWFNRQTQEEFAFLLAKLNEFDRGSQARLVFETVISSLVVSFSNQDSETRYVAVTKTHRSRALINSAGKKLEKALAALEKRGVLPTAEHQVCLGDIRQGVELPDDCIDRVVTSPPYANTMDYYLYHKQRMNILGYSFKTAQIREIGSRHEFSSKKEDVTKWASDYRQGLKEIGRVLKPGGVAILIIGDSQIAGEHIDGRDLTIKASKSLGLKARTLESYSMVGKSRSFKASYQRPDKFEHIVEITK